MQSVDLVVEAEPLAALWSVDLEVANHLGETALLNLGVAEAATDGIDEIYGEVEALPLASSQAFDARFQVLGTRGLTRDIRAFREEKMEWIIQIQAGPEGYPVTLSWNRLELSLGNTFLLQDVLSEGQALSVNMWMQNSVELSGTTVSLLRVISQPSEPLWSIQLEIGNNGAGLGSLTVGMVDNATEGVDPDLGEVAMPPLPPQIFFDVRLLLADTNEVVQDWRNPEEQGAIWTIRIQPGVGGYPIRLAWDRSSLPEEGTFRLRDAITEGEIFNEDMRLYGALEVTNIAVNLVQLVYNDGR